MSIYGQTPQQLVGYVVEIGPFEPEAGGEWFWDVRPLGPPPPQLPRSVPFPQEAFETVRAIVQEQPDLVETLELAGEDEAGRQVLKASGHELAELSHYRQYA